MLAARLALRPGRGDAACLAKRAGSDRPPQTAAELAGHIAAAAARAKTSGLLVFDYTGMTGHPDHRAATGAAALAGHRAGLPVLAWTLPAAVAARLFGRHRQGLRRPAAGPDRPVRSRQQGTAAAGRAAPRQPDLARIRAVTAAPPAR
jgi:LmbE family N-acetylglucosaminyl deacetylase